jgi:hypothetical protein
MRYRLIALLALLVSTAPAAYAQEAAQQSADENKPTLQQRLVPEAAAQLMAPAPADLLEKAEAQPALAAMRPRGTGTGLIIAGGALFVAGLLIGDDAGTVLAVTGAAVGAYGLYLYFQ